MWEVYLSLGDQPHSCGDQVSTGVTFYPAPEEFNSAVNLLLNQYQVAVKGFDSLITDARIMPYVSSSKYDLLKVLEKEASQENEHSKSQNSWIDCFSLFECYIPYREQADQLNKCITLTMLEVQRKFKVSP